MTVTCVMPCSLSIAQPHWETGKIIAANYAFFFLYAFFRNFLLNFDSMSKKSLSAVIPHTEAVQFIH